MNLLLYLNGIKGNAGRLLHAVEGACTGRRIEICNSTRNLQQRLRLGTFDLAVVILVAADRTRLKEILAIRHLLGDIRTILILPDRDSETIAAGLTLRPRYLTFIDTDFSDVSAVLAKMLKFYGNEPDGLLHSYFNPI